MNTPLNQIPSPTDEDRHQMLREALERAGRPDDFDYILKNLSPPPDITTYASPGEQKGMRIGILGGGLAGLTAAYELRKLGAEITILEASSSRIGGRVYTYYFDANQDQYGEFGAMRIPASHETTWHYINLFQLKTLSMTTPRRNNFLYVHQTRLRTNQSVEQYLYPLYQLTLQEKNTPWRELQNYAMEYRMLQLSPEVRSELIQLLPSYSPEYIPLMNLSLRQNFEGLGLSQGAINLISNVDPVSGALLHISYDEIVNEEYSFDYSNTYRIDHGNVNLPQAFLDSFQTNGAVVYPSLPPSSIGSVTYEPGHLVTGIYQSGYHNKVIVKYHSEAGTAAEVFDYVICSLPLSILRTIEIRPYFSNMKMQAIEEFNYIDAQKTLFLCKKRFWERDTDYGNIYGGISFTDLPIQSIIYPSDHNRCLLNLTSQNISAAAADPPSEDLSCSSEIPGVLVASYNLEQNSVRVGGLEPTRRYELISRDVEEVHGLPRGFLNSLVEQNVTVHWNHEPLYLGALSYALPGQKQLFSYELTLPEYQGRVYLAGEHASAKHGWMQGALYSGKAAANQLAKHFHQQYTKDMI